MQQSGTSTFIPFSFLAFKNYPVDIAMAQS